MNRKTWKTAREFGTDAGIDDRCAEALQHDLGELEYADDMILSLGAELTRTIERASAQVRAGQHTNSLGELQRSGQDYDRWHALRAERLTTLIRTCHLIRVDHVAVLAAFYAEGA